jgi:uncharacterized membrane protein
MKYQKINSIDELKKLRQPISNINVQHHEKLSKIDKLALWITNRVGSMGFFLIIFCWTISWLSWNALAPDPMKFDPYPAFVLWLFISNMIQIFLMPLIMIGQNLQSKHSELRAEEDYLINKKAETEIETILMHLENQNELILQILQHLHDPDNKAKKDNEI